MTKRPREPIYGAAIAAGRTLFGFWGLKRRVTGIENLPTDGGAVVAITHFGYLDFALTEWIIWLHTRRHVRFMGKKSVFQKPVIGWLLRSMHHISVDMQAGAAAYANAVTALRGGELLGVFPEAGVSASFLVRDFKTGAVRLSAEAEVPIIPVAVWGGHRLMTKRHKVKFFERFGVPVAFAIGAPITAHLNDDPHLATEQLRATMQGMVDELQATYPVNGSGQWWQPQHLGGTAPSVAEAQAADEARDAARAARAATTNTRDSGTPR
ncbi:lysophospholipid acyltransferase family protein [Leifsonia sp. Leaf264]|uniref:lysophospholipid acyltransferase family protein n=1 Tax=Leifsonia sp. Leaf264 TaxID=1736314 RepID=UPI0006F6D992|nr:lysophospholipid acyltransferase family protein [Leifsonia sp. Leaf264]KQO97599.1 glycerol acyltransferase [Leifsonia sp. Leaf264]